MIYLPSLIQKINTFVRSAIFSHNLISKGQGYTMPDDPEEDAPDTERGEDLGLYSKILQAGNQIADENIRTEVLLIADLYKKALEVNGGYNFVNKAISNSINLLDDEDDDEQSAVEDLLNEVSKDLRNRSKLAGTATTGDSAASLKALQDAKRDFNNKELAEELQEQRGPNLHDENIEAPPLPDEKIKDDLTKYDEKAKGVFDMSGGVNQEVGQSKGRGYRTDHKSFKDWTASYENERQRYLDEARQIEAKSAQTNGLLGKHDKQALERIKELVTVLERMRDFTFVATQLEKKFAEAPSTEITTQLDEIRDKISEMSKKRNELKANIRSYELRNQLKFMEEDLATVKDPRAKFLLQQKKELHELMLGQGKNKSEESKLRRQLIDAMSGGNALTGLTFSTMIQKIEDAKNRRKQENAEFKEKNTTTIHNKRDQEGRIEGKLDGLAIALQQTIASIKNDLRKKIIKKLSSDPNVLAQFAPYLQKIEAVKGTPAEKQADKDLKSAQSAYAVEDPDIKNFVAESARLYKFRDTINQLHMVGMLYEENELAPAEKVEITKLYDEGRELLAYYATRPKPFTQLQKPLFAIVERLKKKI
jgi:hypothetical protein